MTAAHNLVLHHRGTVVRAIYKERMITLDWLRRWSDVRADIAVLRLRGRPDDLRIEPLPVGYLDPDVPASRRRQFWAGRTVVAFGHVVRGGSPEAHRVDGMIDTQMPQVDSYPQVPEQTRIGLRETEHGRRQQGSRSVSPVPRLRIKGSGLSLLRGMSGAAIYDLESHTAIAVQGSYVRPDPDDPDVADARATEIGHLLRRVPGLRLIAVHLGEHRRDRHECGNLPQDATPFIGRSREVTDVRRLVGAHRVVTLTGPGGVGKTRLAVEACRAMAGTMPGGVWVAELGSLADSGAGGARRRGALRRPESGR